MLHDDTSIRHGGISTHWCMVQCDLELSVIDPIVRPEDALPKLRAEYPNRVDMVDKAPYLAERFCVVVLDLVCSIGRDHFHYYVLIPSEII